MHFYPFHVGDYETHTKGLSLMEDLAYRRMLDQYHLHEQPLNGSSTLVARRIGMAEHVDAVQWVLDEFFVLDDNQADGPIWRNKRADEEIAKYNAIQNKKRKAGKASGARRREQALNTCSAGDEQNSVSVEPTKNQEPRTNKGPPSPLRGDDPPKGVTRQQFKRPTTEQVRAYCNERQNGIDPEQFIDHYTANGWVQARGKPIKDWKAAVRTWERREANHGHIGRTTHTRRLSAVDEVRAAQRRAEAERQGQVVATVERDD